MVAFGGSKIGVMWSNQSSTNDAMYFAVHEDGQPDATWQASATAIQGPCGSSTSYSVTAHPLDGFSGPVTLSASGLSAGATASFDPNPLELPQSSSSTLSVRTSGTTKNGSYPVRITGSGGSLTRSRSVTLQIKRK